MDQVGVETGINFTFYISVLNPIPCFIGAFQFTMITDQLNFPLNPCTLRSVRHNHYGQFIRGFDLLLRLINRNVHVF